jgi:hypothetical protein
MAAAFFVVLTLTVIGIMIALAIDRDLSGLSLIGLGFLYGSGAVYVVMLALSVVGVRWSMLNVTAVLLLISGVRFFSSGLGPRASCLGGKVTMSPIDVVTVIVFAFYVWYATRVAASHWDFRAIWGLKARMFFEARGIDWHFLGSRWNAFAHPDYPLLLPLNDAYVALAAGEWSDRWIGIHAAAFALALLLIVREEAARETTPHKAAAITLATTAFALSPQIGLADGPLIAFGGAALLLIRRSGDTAFRHAAILLGLAAATKNEGMTLCVAVVIALIVARTPWRKIARLWPALILAAPWLILRAAHHLPTDLATPGMLGRLTARVTALPQLGQSMLETLSNPILWSLVAISLVIVPFRLLRTEKLVLVTTLVQLLFFTLAYLVTPLDAAWHVVSSFGRISTQLGVPVTFVVMTMLARTASP